MGAAGLCAGEGLLTGRTGQPRAELDQRQKEKRARPRAWLATGAMLFVLLAAISTADIEALDSDYANLTHWFWLDETSGTTVYDSAGGPDAAFAGGAATWQTANCIQRGCLAFDGTDDDVIINDHAGLDVTKITWASWVNVTTLQNGFLLQRSCCWSVRISATGEFVVIMGAGFSEKTATQTLKANVWYHLGATFDGTKTRLYINGTIDSEFVDAGSLTGGTSSVRIGSNNGNGAFLPFRLDDFRWYNYALPPTAVATIYNQTRGNNLTRVNDLAGLGGGGSGDDGRQGDEASNTTLNSVWATLNGTARQDALLSVWSTLNDTAKQSTLLSLWSSVNATAKQEYLWDLFDRANLTAYESTLLQVWASVNSTALADDAATQSTLLQVWARGNLTAFQSTLLQVWDRLNATSRESTMLDFWSDYNATEAANVASLLAELAGLGVDHDQSQDWHEGAESRGNSSHQEILDAIAAIPTVTVQQTVTETQTVATMAPQFSINDTRLWQTSVYNGNATDQTGTSVLDAQAFTVTTPHNLSLLGREALLSVDLGLQANATGSSGWTWQILVDGVATPGCSLRAYTGSYPIGVSPADPYRVDASQNCNLGNLTEGAHTFAVTRIHPTNPISANATHISAKLTFTDKVSYQVFGGIMIPLVTQQTVTVTQETVTVTQITTTVENITGNQTMTPNAYLLSNLPGMNLEDTGAFFFFLLAMVAALFFRWLWPAGAALVGILVSLSTSIGYSLPGWTVPLSLLHFVVAVVFTAVANGWTISRDTTGEG